VLVSEESGIAGDNGYDKDTSLTFCGTDLEESAILYVNNSPVEMLAEAGCFYRISEWLSPGRNVVCLGGRFDQNLYVKVITLRSRVFATSREFERVVAKMRVPRQDGPAAKEPKRLVFNADIGYSPIMDRLPTEGEAKESLHNEVRGWLDMFMREVRKHDADKAEAIGHAPWDLRPRWGVERDVFGAKIARIKEKYGARDVELTTKVEDFKLLSGEYCVLVWAGRCHRDFHEGEYEERDYSFSWSQPALGKHGRDSVLRLVRVGGLWEIW
jgi:hypothetical protein